MPINLYLNSTFIPILLLFPFFILEFAILCQKMYNQAKEKKKNKLDEGEIMSELLNFL